MCSRRESTSSDVSSLFLVLRNVVCSEAPAGRRVRVSWEGDQRVMVMGCGVGAWELGCEGVVGTRPCGSR